MAKKIFEKAGLITPPGAQTSRSEGTSQPGHEAKPKTAPGAMLQFIGQQSAAVREVEELREKLREFDGAAVVRSIDPEQIRASRWANRHESSYSDQEFLQLKEEIRSAGGLRVLTTILDKVFDKLDSETIVAGVTDYSYDLTR